MQNTISQDQNTPRQLERLAAQRLLYSRAKKVLAIQGVLDVFTPVIVAVLIVIVPEFDIYGVFIAVGVTVFDFILDMYQSSRKKQAADIQEMFDCDVLGLECLELKIRRRPIVETIMESAKKYKRIEPTYASLRDWYPPIVEKIPLSLARLICQRENCWWDAQLRRRYTQLVGSILVVISIVVVLLGLIKGITIGRFFLVIVCPLLPAYIWAIREYFGQTDAASEKDELRKYSEELWVKALKGEFTDEKICKESRHLQDEIYNNRRTNPFILDCFYKWLRKENEEEINRGAEELVNEALQILDKQI
jgi:MFS superfamily sulfate permease-like transporter